MISTHHKPLSTTVTTVTWVVSLVIVAFYLLSTAGWLGATYMAFSGALGEEARTRVNELSIIGHAIRISQVLLILTASVLLVLRKRATLTFFLITLGCSAISTMFVGAWTVSFIGGIFSFFLLTAVSMYAYWLKRHEVLR